jgi:hypothetical protein
LQRQQRRLGIHGFENAARDCGSGAASSIGRHRALDQYFAATAGVGPMRQFTPNFTT